jgi:hypothetical protein
MIKTILDIFLMILLFTGLSPVVMVYATFDRQRPFDDEKISKIIRMSMITGYAIWMIGLAILSILLLR